MSPELSRMVEAHVHAGPIQVHDNPAHLTKAKLAEARDDYRSENTSDSPADTRSNGGHVLEHFLVSYCQHEDRGPAGVTFCRDKSSTTTVANALTSQYLREKAEIRPPRLSLVTDRWHDHQSYPSSDKVRPGFRGSRTRQLMSSDRADGSASASFADLVDQCDRRIDSRKAFTISDKDSRWNDGEDPSASTSTNAYAKEAIAAVADELERLRAAIRRSIDDLERVRGSVQTPLPALPPNRGAFRIS